MASASFSSLVFFPRLAGAAFFAEVVTALAFGLLIGFSSSSAFGACSSPFLMAGEDSVSSASSFLTEDLAGSLFARDAFGLTSGSDSSSSEDASFRLTRDFWRFVRLNGEFSGVPLLRFLL
jgi:hypothetical protein